MIPLRAENPRRTFEVVNVLLIAVNVVVFLYQVSLPPKVGDKLILNLGVVPARAGQVLALTRPSIRVAGVLQEQCEECQPNPYSCRRSPRS